MEIKFPNQRLEKLSVNEMFNCYPVEYINYYWDYFRHYFMKLSECKIGTIVKINSENTINYSDYGIKDSPQIAHEIGFISGLGHNEFEVIPKVTFASGMTNKVHHSNLELFTN